MLFTYRVNWRPHILERTQMQFATFVMDEHKAERFWDGIGHGLQHRLHAGNAPFRKTALNPVQSTAVRVFDTVPMDGWGG